MAVGKVTVYNLPLPFLTISLWILVGTSIAFGLASAIFFVLSRQSETSKDRIKELEERIRELEKRAAEKEKQN